jgi:hypothetical protein
MLNSLVPCLYLWIKVKKYKKKIDLHAYKNKYIIEFDSSCDYKSFMNHMTVIVSYNLPT